MWYSTIVVAVCGAHGVGIHWVHDVLQKRHVSDVWGDDCDGTHRSALLMDERITIVVLDSETKTSGIDATVAPDEEGSEDRLRQEVEYSVEYSLGIRSDHVATLAQSPSNRIKDP
jgi:hypothetical protein